MKKFLCTVFMTGILLAGCGSDANNATNDTTESVISEFSSSDSADDSDSIEDIYAEASALTDTKLVSLDDTLIENYYGVNTDDFDDYVFAQAEDPKSAEMIIIAKAKDGVDISTYKSNIDNIIEQKTGEMTNYNEPEQVELLENAKTEFTDSAMIVVVSDEADTITDTIKEKLGL